MSIIKNKSMILAVVITFATTLLVAGGLNVNTDNQSVFAKKIKSNNSTQGVLQDQFTGQSSEVFSENGNSTASGNNVALSFNLNDGNNALGQQ
ncbi:hypothetical protein NMY3_00590 [Candidatus Nitrosocosmicus oleophilus]|uniref:Uncharacterized protein n=1 Tax=Candidatus Nitrosocosmicus oleophilus TaxID=1353260 RepID=A0A654LVH2_9ARCH|nr:hypothetical protein [Candidatus Nitrosocosmicus oleophilus]ALI34800.1 hypothetical protein NMY3_00590 [Candidatus Nitrosocosmicus oleophilus]